jgi:mRNA-degrading endonuclease toxin of MazEF toxin-antitoxin module
MRMADAGKAAGLSSRKIVAGGIYLLKDSLIRFSESDAQGHRRKHDFRIVLVLSNQQIIDSYACPCVMVAPMSHRTDYCSLADLLIAKNATNQLKHDSRILMGYLQPVMKSDLEKQIGLLSEEEWQSAMEKIVYCFDH